MNDSLYSRFDLVMNFFLVKKLVVLKDPRSETENITRYFILAIYCFQELLFLQAFTANRDARAISFYAVQLSAQVLLRIVRGSQLTIKGSLGHPCHGYGETFTFAMKAYFCVSV